MEMYTYTMKHSLLCIQMANSVDYDVILHCFLRAICSIS